MISLKRSGILLFLSLYIFININSEPENQIVNTVIQTEQTTAEQEQSSRWSKRLFYLFGFLNGFYLPVSYALALGVDAFELSNPVFKEKLEPFAKGAMLGIGFWFAYKIVEWYLQVAVLKALNVTIQNPIISKILLQNSSTLQQNVSTN